MTLPGHVDKPSRHNSGLVVVDEAHDLDF